MASDLMARRIDLNADLGEGFPNDAALLDRVTSASVACGAHAGDLATLEATLRTARSRGVAIGAHPGYADREGFGRRELDLPPAEIARQIIDQVEHVRTRAAMLGVRVGFVKPHGALYNQAQRDAAVSGAVIAALGRWRLPLLGQPGSLLETNARAAGIPYVTEGFPDRRYRADGRLAPRSEPDALHHDPAEIETQVLRLLADGVMTLCIHGDDPRAVTNAEIVRSVLERHGIAIATFVEGTITDLGIPGHFPLVGP
jgi:UPF0271 protein